MFPLSTSHKITSESADAVSNLVESSYFFPKVSAKKKKKGRRKNKNTREKRRENKNKKKRLLEVQISMSLLLNRQKKFFSIFELTRHIKRPNSSFVPFVNSKPFTSV